MAEYKGFKYLNIGASKWQLIYPAGFKTTIEADNEDHVKEKIDFIIENFAKP